MKTITINAYYYSELDAVAKKRARDNFFDHYLDDWHWECYEDADTMNLKINSFDLYRKEIDIEFKIDAEETAKAIMKYGSLGMIELAEEWKKDVNAIFNSFSDYDKYLDWLRAKNYDLDDMEFEDWVIEESGYSGDKESINYDFLYQLGECYLQSLQHDYDYKQSEEYMEECFDANENLFDINGNLIN